MDLSTFSIVEMTQSDALSLSITEIILSKLLINVRLMEPCIMVIVLILLDNFFLYEKNAFSHKCSYCMPFLEHEYICTLELFGMNRNIPMKNGHKERKLTWKKCDY